MAETGLSFGSLNIVVAGTNSYYEQLDSRPERANVVNVGVPMTKGMVAKVIAQEFDPETSKGFDFRGYIVKDTEAELLTLKTSCKNYMSDPALLIQTLSFATPRWSGAAQPEENMRMTINFPRPHHKRPDDGKWMLEFFASFVKYSGGS